MEKCGTGSHQLSIIKLQVFQLSAQIDLSLAASLIFFCIMEFRGDGGIFAIFIVVYKNETIKQTSPFASDALFKFINA